MWSRTMLTAVLVVLAACSARAQDGTAVTACDTLIAARRIDAASGSARDAPLEAGCRRIPRGEIGTVEQRAMIGGAPYECMTVAGSGRCLWIVP
ncbi:hypothetical protein [Methylobacterium sp. NEAU K]|uniref:hypothetical protein n=1 Tax=Methylobacterium sp. NEAU K TaxID=3064946 RepID=UPI002733A479|nr:hypothetical protein [Methylobacterium sp. NEAU K]MDP4002632.1 hypothetical protein [Methylobacterium sp. NEAU K]